MDITLYAFQFSPHDDEEMFFNETLEACRAEAEGDRKMIRRDPDYDHLTPFPIYECVVRMDVATYAKVLSEPSHAVKHALVSKKLIGLVVD